MKKNVAIIIPGGIGTGSNNIGVPVLERIIRLLAIDFNLTVFQLFPVNKDFKVEGFELIAVYSRNAVFKSVKLILAFWKEQRRNKFQAVHGFWALPNGFLAVLMGKIFKIKSVVSLLGGDAIALPDIAYGQLINPFYRKLIFWTLNSGDEINALTSYLVNNLRQAGLQRENIKIIPWGIDTSMFVFRKKPLTSPVQFLHIANLHPVKDQETLLRSFKIISDEIDARLTIIGEGISEGFVRGLAVELGIENKITFVGLLPYEQLPKFYCEADLLLHTSRSEGQSEVVTEAMSCGVIVCGTRVGLMYDQPDCCVSVPVKDFKALANEVLILLRDPKRMDVIRTHAHAWTSFHSINWTVKKIKELYY